MILWDWALTVYARPGVAEACLELQDAHGQNVPLLLAAAWAADQGRSLDPDRAVALAAAWDKRAVLPLRTARRGLKDDVAGIDQADREALRATVKAAELAAERLLLEALERLATSDPGAGRDVRLALIHCAAAFAATRAIDPPPATAMDKLSALI